MTDLLNISKECGADDVTTENCPETILMLSESQLHATVEKVSAPLVEALHQAETDLYHAQIRATYLNEVFANHRKLMGQDK